MIPLKVSRKLPLSLNTLIRDHSTKTAFELPKVRRDPSSFIYTVKVTPPDTNETIMLKIKQDQANTEAIKELVRQISGGSSSTAIKPNVWAI